MTSVNNDVAAAAFATLLLWGIVRLVQRGFSWSCMAWCVAWAAICFWTKTTTFPVIGSLALALPLSLLKERGRGMVWTMFGLLTAITLLLALQWDEVSGWFHTGTQQGASRRATSQAYSGQYAFELSPGISSAAYRQIIPVESIQFMRGQTVTVSAWMWSESLDPQPATTPALILENAIPGVLYQAITITHQPVRFTFTSTVPANTGRIWLALQSSTQPISTSIFYDDISVKRTGFDLNLVQNPSAENGTARLRAVLATKIFPYFGTYPGVLLSTLTSPVSAKDYIVAAVNSLLQTFWARFGWGHVPVLYKAIYPLLNLLFISGTLFGGYIFISRYLRQRHAKVHALAVLGCVVALGWFVAWSRGIPSLMENWWLPSARYTYPVVVPTLLFVIGGWVALPNSATGLRLRNWAAPGTLRMRVRRRPFAHSVLGRIHQTFRHPEARDIHRPVDAGNDRHEPHVRRLEVEEQDHAVGQRGVAVIESVFHQMRDARGVDGSGPPHRAGRDAREDRHEVRRRLRLAPEDELRVAGEFLEEVTQCLLVIRGMLQPLTQDAKVQRKILRRGVHDCGDTPRLTPEAPSPRAPPVCP